MVCGLLYGMWPDLWYTGCSIYVLQYMWAVEWYVGCCMVSELLYGIWAVVEYVACCFVYGLLGIRAAVYVGF